MNDWIARPHLLWLLLPAVPLLLWPLRHSLARLTPWQQRVCVAARGLLLTLLALALAGVRVPWQSHELSVVFAVDRSASVSPEAEQEARVWIAEALRHQGGGDTAQLVGFAKTATVLPAEPNADWPQQPERNATATGNAITFSQALLSEGKIGRLVLLSDGYDTEGSALDAAQAARGSGVELMTVSLQNRSLPETLVERLELPQELAEGEPFDATAWVKTNGEGNATVRLYANGFLQSEENVALKPGSTPVAFRNLRPDKSTATYEVEVATDHDTRPDNNRAKATVLRRGEPRLLIVDPEPERLQPLRDVLARGRIQVEIRPLQGLPKTLDDLQRYDAFFLSDVAALQLTRPQMELYARWVTDFGGGFAMLGGENSFGSGGFFKTPLDPVLPVKAEHDDRIDSPSVAVMVVLDSSGSMGAPVAGQTKMALANQGAALALEVLQPKDLLGVTAVDSKVHEIAPLARHPQRDEVRQNILRVTAGGGGIYVYTSLLDAFSRLRETNAAIRHIILFSDAADAEEKASGEMPDGSSVPGTAMDLVATMAAARISTSVVALGAASDKDTGFLKELAAAGNGRFYLTGDALSLPQIFTTETMRVAQNSLVEEPVRTVAATTGSGFTDGIAWNQAPLLLGYNLTKLKPTAELLLATERGDPLLATWRVGLGQVAAFTSDAKSRWAAEWLDWEGYGAFWTQFARQLFRRGSAAGGALSVETTRLGDDRLRVEVDAVTADGHFRDRLPLRIGTVTAGGERRVTEMRQVAPGRYEAQIPVATAETTWVNLSSPEETGLEKAFGFTPPYPAEFLNNGTDDAALAALAESVSGRHAPAPEAVFERPVEGVRRFADLTSWFLVAALLLLPVDIWLRRRSW
ncbi:MAG TPA: glutamine amidotransferase [Chthoniobacteraceae bacterium]|nr:glutamine amidotransferase [Chthoniobacteraceae bacterium]